MLSVCTVTPARLRRVIRVELRRLGEGMSGCRGNASETHGYVHSGVLIPGRCGERGLFCPQNIRKTDCIQVIGKKHAILQQH